MAVFDVQYYAELLEEIRLEMMLSRGELAELIGISRTTYDRLYDKDNTIPQANKTMRKIKTFVTKHRKDQ